MGKYKNNATIPISEMSTNPLTEKFPSREKSEKLF